MHASQITEPAHVASFNPRATSILWHEAGESALHASEWQAEVEQLFHEVEQCVARLMRGAPCAVRKVGYLPPIFPDGQGDARTTVFLPRFPLSPKTQLVSSNQTIFPTARLLSKSAVLPCGRSLPGGG